MYIITISRGSLSGSRQLGEHLSEKFNIPFISREDVIQHAIDGFHMKESGLGDISIFDGSPVDWKKSTSNRQLYLLSFASALLDIGLRGSFIYDGHVGQLLLASLPFVLRIRVVQSEEKRIESLMSKKKISQDQALNQIKMVDERRKKWAEYLYAVNIEDPLLYDSTFNVSELNYEIATNMISDLLSQPKYHSTQESQKSLKDAYFSTLSKLFMKRSPLTRNLEFNIEANSDEGFLVIKDIIPTLPNEKFQENVKTILSEVRGIKAIKFENVN